MNRTFFPDVSKSMRLLVGFVITLFLIRFVIGLIQHGPNVANGSLNILGYIFGIMIIILMLLSLFIYFFSRVVVNQEGIRCGTYFGYRAFVPWGEISGLEIIRYYFLPYLKIKRCGKRIDLWVPLFLQDNNEFKNFLRLVNPVGEGIEVFIEENGF